MTAKHPEQLTRVDILNLSTALLDSRTYPNMLINISPRVVTKLRLCGLSIVTVRPTSGDIEIYTATPVPLSPEQSADVRRQVSNHVEHVVPIGAAIHLSRIPCRIAQHATIAFTGTARTWSVPIKMPENGRGYLMAHGDHSSAAGRLVVGELRLVASLLADAIHRNHRQTHVVAEAGVSLACFSAKVGPAASKEVGACLDDVVDTMQNRFAHLPLRRLSIDNHRLVLLCGRDVSAADRLLNAVVAHINILFPTLDIKAEIVSAPILGQTTMNLTTTNAPTEPSAPAERRKGHGRDHASSAI